MGDTVNRISEMAAEWQRHVVWIRINISYITAELSYLSGQGTNVHDMKATMETLDSTVVQRPTPRPYHRENLCLDKGYDFPEIEVGAIQRGTFHTSDTEERRSSARSATDRRGGSLRGARPGSTGSGSS